METEETEAGGPTAPALEEGRGTGRPSGRPLTPSPTRRLAPDQQPDRPGHQGARLPGPGQRADAPGMGPRRVPGQLPTGHSVNKRQPRSRSVPGGEWFCTAATHRGGWGRGSRPKRPGGQSRSCRRGSETPREHGGVGGWREGLGGGEGWPRGSPRAAGACSPRPPLPRGLAGSPTAARASSQNTQLTTSSALLCALQPRGLAAATHSRGAACTPQSQARETCLRHTSPSARWCLRVSSHQPVGPAVGRGAPSPCPPVARGLELDPSTGRGGVRGLEAHPCPGAGGRGCPLRGTGGCPGCSANTWGPRGVWVCGSPPARAQADRARPSSPALPSGVLRRCPGPQCARPWPRPRVLTAFQESGQGGGSRCPAATGAQAGSHSVAWGHTCPRPGVLPGCALHPRRPGPALRTHLACAASPP